MTLVLLFLLIFTHSNQYCLSIGIFSSIFFFSIFSLQFSFLKFKITWSRMESKSSLYRLTCGFFFLPSFSIFISFFLLQKVQLVVCPFARNTDTEYYPIGSVANNTFRIPINWRWWWWWWFCFLFFIFHHFEVNLFPAEWMSS